MTAAPQEANMSLGELRGILLRLEETILFGLIERATVALNPKVYERGEAGVWGPEMAQGPLASRYSYLEYLLYETERVHSQVARFTAEEENAFFPGRLPAPLLRTPDRPRFLKANNINYNKKLLQIYRDQILPAICDDTDDTHYGSAACADILVLQALSKRIHLGKQVAEVKFRAQTEEYTEMIRQKDAAGIMRLLTNQGVEDRLIKRVEVKAATYGQEVRGPDDARAGGESAAPMKIEPSVAAKIYHDLIIPLTKDIEVDYLLQRLDFERRVSFLGPPGTFAHLAAKTHFQDAAFEPCQDIGAVCQAVLENRTIYGVVPASNSISGPSAETHAALLGLPIKVCGEVYLKVVYQLLARPDATALSKIYSHPNVLQQCRPWLAEAYPDVSLIKVDSTSTGADLAAESADSAAIGSSLVAALTSLKVLSANLETTQKENITRFLVITKVNLSASPSGDDRTMLVLELKQERLAAALAQFHACGVEVMAVENTKLAASMHKMLVELKGHVDDENVSALLAALQGPGVEATTTVLGSFGANPTIYPS